MSVASDSESVCVRCRRKFDVEIGKRRRVGTSLKDKGSVSVATAISVIDRKVVTDGDYVCSSCYNELDRLIRKRPLPSSPSHQVPPPKSAKLVGMLAANNYRGCFELLRDSNASARQAFQELACDDVKKDAKRYAAAATSLRYQGLASMEAFDLSEHLEEMKEAAPLMSGVLQGMMPETSDPEQQKVVDARTSFVAGVVASTHHPRTRTLYQAAGSVLMWQDGCSEKLYQKFNRLGVTQSKSSAVRRVDEICDDVDTVMDVRKKKFAADCEQPPPHGMMDPVLDPEWLGRPCSQESDDTFTLSQATAVSEEVPIPIPYVTVPTPPVSASASLVSTSSSTVTLNGREVPGYTCVFDNVQKYIRPTHVNSRTPTHMDVWTNTAAVINRVPYSYLRAEDDDRTLSAATLPNRVFLPNADDREEYFARAVMVVARLLVRFDMCAKTDEVLFHIPHQHSPEMAQKSEVINGGVIGVNPGSTAGSITVAEHMQKVFCPRRSDGAMVPLIAHADGGAVVTMMGAKTRRAADFTPEERLEGIEPFPQELHHQMTFLGDYVKRFLKGSCLSKGSLGQIRNAFRFRNVGAKSITETYNDVEDFVEVVTLGHILLLGLTISDMKAADLGKKTSKFGVMELAKKIVTQLWQLHSAEEMQAVLDAVPEEEKDAFYDWAEAEEPVSATAEVSAQTAPTEAAPAEAVAAEAQKSDQVYDYARQHTWMGLMHLVHKDCIREGDGPAMLLCWKVHLPYFWCLGNTIYLPLAHRMLAAVAGVYPPRLVHDLVHNRTVNLVGGPGRNLGVDKLIEIGNKDFKRLLDHTNGNYGRGVISRAGKLLGEVGKTIDRAFGENLADLCPETDTRTRHQRLDKLVVDFLREYADPENKEDDLFRQTPGRTHRGINGLTPLDHIAEPHKLAGKLALLTSSMAREQRIRFLAPVPSVAPQANTGVSVTPED